jgi:hypothetical protein
MDASYLLAGGHPMSIESTRARHEERLMSLPNVVGVGIGERDGKPVIQVLVTHRQPDLPPQDRVPENVDGFPVAVEEIGAVQAQDAG